MADISQNAVVLQSPEGQRLLLGTAVRQTLLIRIFSKQFVNGYCGLHSAALLMSARHFGKKYPDTLQHSDCDVSDVPFLDTNMFEFPETNRVMQNENLLREGTTLKEIQELFQAFGVGCERCHTSESSVDEFRSRAMAALSHADSSHGVVVNFEMELNLDGKFIILGHLSPLAAYHEASDCFLLLDTSVHKRELWVPTRDLFEKMNTKDNVSALKRGFVIANFMSGPA
ncbi:uncharacterized protein [Diadema antillarum]|uniref:uncharacterized protein n=1 Tax=Diadema antillarum TaxID=105358 RepID=UPI003A867BB9